MSTTPRHPAIRAARILLPIVMSVAIFAYLFHHIDAAAVLESITIEIALPFTAILIVFNLVTLAIEAQCLHRVVHSAGTTLERLTAARIKAACYLPAIFNYVFGAAGLTILLRRRSGLSIADSGSRVFLISLFDFGVILAIAAVSAAFLQVDGLGVRMGLVLGFIFLILSGFAFLRIPTPFATLERIRLLEIFVGPRTAPYSLLLELALLRFAFVACYIILAYALFWAFEIPVDPLSLGLKVSIMLVVAALPIAASGLGTGQLVFVELFRGLAPETELLAASLLFSIGLILSRGILGALFSLEFTKEAFQAAREESAL